MTGRERLTQRRLLPHIYVAPIDLLIVALSCAAIGLFLVWTRWLEPIAAPATVPLWLLAILFFASERFVLDLTLGRETHSFSLSEIPLVIGLFFALPAELVIAQAVGAGIALRLRPGQTVRKLSFNLANFAVGAIVATFVFRLFLDPLNPLAPSGWLAAFAAVLVADVLGSVAVALAISATQRQSPSLSSLFGSGTAYTLVDTSLALVAVVVLWFAPAMSWLLVVLAGLTYVGLRIHRGERRRHQSLEELHRSTREVQASLDFAAVEVRLLATARDMFAGGLAEITLFSGPGEPARLTTLTSGAGAIPQTRVQALDPTEGLWARVAAERRGFLLAEAPARGRVSAQLIGRLEALLGEPQVSVTSEQVRRHFADRGIRNAIIAPLQRDEVVVGTLLVGNRQGSSQQWRAADRTLFETLANHASISLVNARQAAELRRRSEENRHQATHDALTELPNRRLFGERLGQAIDAASVEGRHLAVATMDIDRFKEVNDTLGHNNGDLLLQAIAKRLRAVVGQEATIARLGGDEFAVLIAPSAGQLDGANAAQTLLGALAEPFAMQDLSLEVEASVGVAFFPEHGGDAVTLLQRADVAMYIAKQAKTGFEVYAADRDQYSTGRLALMGELRGAIDREELEIYYQPQADARTGSIVSAEALVRWNHPRHGLIEPGQFVPVAEHTGLIRPLTRWVLAAATRQAALWAAAGTPLRVAVNLSARDLADDQLTDDVRRILAQTGLPPSSLELEITETGIMTDPVRTAAVLDRLVSTGVEVAIDDFGTGFGSLSYLKRLPVHEIKIDRSFVSNMIREERDLEIVRSTIQLGHNLKLRVVAEGVETRAEAQRLARLGVDVLQGFYIGRAVPAEQITIMVKAGEPGQVGARAQTARPPRSRGKRARTNLTLLERGAAQLRRPA